jgi:hypothetical protein
LPKAVLERPHQHSSVYAVGVDAGYHIDSLRITSIVCSGDLMYTVARYEATNAGQKALGVNLVVVRRTGSGGELRRTKPLCQTQQRRSSSSTPPARTESASALAAQARWPRHSYFGGAGVNPSRLWPGSGFGFGLGAFLASFLPLSLLPMSASVP